MNVLFFMSAGNDGVAYHRLFLPSMYLQNHEVRRRTKQLYPQDMEWADVLVISRVLDGSASEIKTVCSQYNVKLIVDVDDLWVLPQNHILHGYYQRTMYGQKQQDYLYNADAVWTTNERLAEEIKPYNENVHIIPNALPFGEDQFNDQRNPSECLRFFYAGGHTHKHDINLLKDINRELRKDELFKSKAQFVLAGGYEQRDDVYVDKIWDDMEFVYSGHAIKAATYKRIYGKGVDEYMDLYKDADIGLIPLEDNRFTRCKSNLKILECAAKKIPVICSNVSTYKDNHPPIDYFSNDKELKRIIVSYLNHDPEFIEQCGDDLFEWAMMYHYLPEVNKLREENIKKLFSY